MRYEMLEPTWICWNCRETVSMAELECARCGMSREGSRANTAAELSMVSEVNMYWRCWNCQTNVPIEYHRCIDCNASQKPPTRRIHDLSSTDAADPWEVKREAERLSSASALNQEEAEELLGVEVVLQTGTVDEDQWRTSVLIELKAIRRFLEMIFESR